MTPQPSAARLDAILATMAAEDPSTRLDRWQHRFDQLAGPDAHHLVLCGAATSANSSSIASAP